MLGKALDPNGNDGLENGTQCFPFEATPRCAWLVTTGKGLGNFT